MKKKNKIPKGYDSKFEHTLHKKELRKWEYHPQEKISYVVPSTYEADFFAPKVCMDNDCKCTDLRSCKSWKKVYIEVKGRFRTRQEATKYIYIRESLKENEEIIFIFQDSNTPMPFAQKRKDGTKQTVGEWARKNGFHYECYKKGFCKWFKTLLK